MYFKCNQSIIFLNPCMQTKQNPINKLFQFRITLLVFLIGLSFLSLLVANLNIFKEVNTLASKALQNTLGEKNIERGEKYEQYFGKVKSNQSTNQPLNTSLLKTQLFNSSITTLTVDFACTSGLINVANLNDNGAGSLREALLSTNTQPGCQKIEFQIDNSLGVDLIQPANTNLVVKTFTIDLQTPLPTITEGVFIDGTTQPGYNPLTPRPLIELNGANVVGFNNECGQTGLCYNSSLPNMNSKVSAISIVGFKGNGISYGGESVTSGNSIILEGNYIGIRPDGISKKANGNAGIAIANTSGNVIGGDAVSKRNIISGNLGDGIYLFSADTTYIQGNFIGTDRTGNIDLGNHDSGIYLDFSYFVTIGGSEASQRNVISGNGKTIQDGITLIGDNYGVSIRGNRIGTNFNASSRLGNAYSGIYVTDNNNKLVTIGSCQGTRNIISGNGKASSVDQFGVVIFNNDSVVQGNLMGINISGNALNDQRKDLYVGGNTNSIGGNGRCNNIFKNGVDNIENIGFGNKFLGNTGTNVPPTVAISHSPVGEITEPGPVILNVDVVDETEISKVEFILEGKVIATDTTAPFSYELTNVTTNIAPIYARAIDSGGLSSNSSFLKITVKPKVYNVMLVNSGLESKFNPVFSTLDGRLYQVQVASNGAINTRTSFDGENWSDYTVSGNTNEKVTQVSFENKIIQAHRGQNNEIYTRFTTDGVNWSGWQNSGGTLGDITMKVFKDTLVQSVFGTDSMLYTRSTKDGVGWSNWSSSIRVIESSVFASTGNTLFQTVRSSGGTISIRSSTDGVNWGVFFSNGAALIKPTLVSSGSTVIQAVSGTDNGAYVRSVSDNGISPWKEIGKTFFEVDAGFNSNVAYVSYTSTANNSETCNHYSTDMINWSGCESSPSKASRVEYVGFDNRLWTFYRGGGNQTLYRTTQGISNTPWNIIEKPSLDGATTFVFKGKLIVNIVDASSINNVYLIS